MVQHEATASYISGTSLAVLYDPAQPERVIVPGRSWGSGLMVGLGVFFIGVGVLGGIAGVLMLLVFRDVSSSLTSVG